MELLAACRCSCVSGPEASERCSLPYSHGAGRATEQPYDGTYRPVIWRFDITGICRLVTRCDSCRAFPAQGLLQHACLAGGPALSNGAAGKAAATGYPPARCPPVAVQRVPATRLAG